MKVRLGDPGTVIFVGSIQDDQGIRRAIACGATMIGIDAEPMLAAKWIQVVQNEAKVDPNRPKNQDFLRLVRATTRA